MRKTMVRDRLSMKRRRAGTYEFDPELVAEEAGLVLVAEGLVESEEAARLPVHERGIGSQVNFLIMKFTRRGRSRTMHKDERDEHTFKNGRVDLEAHLEA
jgi:hypothetical protein